MSDKKEGVYFPGLNGLRFLAAFLVIFHHIEQIRFKFGLSNHWSDRNVREMGELGVTLFFVLSGFLITYLLIKEKEKFKTISIGQFYARRILRIWPLYYLIAFLALFIFPHISFLSIPGWTEYVGGDLWSKSILFLLILPNVSNFMFPPIPFAGQLWSIGVEEQFYLIWPLIIRFSKNYLRWLTGVIVFIVVIRNVLDFFSTGEEVPHPLHSQRLVTFWYVYFETLRISCMAIGGLGAYLLINKKEKILNLIYKRRVQIAAIGLSIFFISLGIRIPLIHHEVYAVLFAIIVLNIATNPKSILKLQNWWLDYLGKISYGIYMYHFLAIVIVLKCMVLFFNCDITNSNEYLLLALCTGALAIVFASLSYHFFEVPFLKLKHRFTRIESGS